MLKVGIIGLGKMGTLHARTVQQHPHCVLSGVYDIDHTKTAAYCGMNPAVTMYRHPEELYSCDAIIIAVPATRHFEVMEYFLNSKQHMLCEKPLVTSDQEYDALEQILRDEQRVVQVGYCETFSDSAVNFQSSGVAASIQPFSTVSLIRESIATTNNDVNIILDTMTHDIDLLYNFFPELDLPQNIAVVAAKSDAEGQITLSEIRLEYRNTDLNFVLRSEKPGTRTARFLEIRDKEGWMNYQLDFISGKANGIPVPKQQNDNLSRQLNAFTQAITDHLPQQEMRDRIRKVCLTTSMIDRMVRNALNTGIGAEVK